jgi:hypothetical protein
VRLPLRPLTLPLTVLRAAVGDVVKLHLFAVPSGDPAVQDVADVRMRHAVGGMGVSFNVWSEPLTPETLVMSADSCSRCVVARHAQEQALMRESGAGWTRTARDTLASRPRR